MENPMAIKKKITRNLSTWRSWIEWGIHKNGRTARGRMRGRKEKALRFSWELHILRSLLWADHTWVLHCLLCRAGSDRTHQLADLLDGRPRKSENLGSSLAYGASLQSCLWWQSDRGACGCRLHCCCRKCTVRPRLKTHSRVFKRLGWNQFDRKCTNFNWNSSLFNISVLVHGWYLRPDLCLQFLF
jgi:hypothetical protein